MNKIQGALLWLLSTSLMVACADNPLPQGNADGAQGGIVGTGGRVTGVGGSTTGTSAVGGSQSTGGVSTAAFGGSPSTGGRSGTGGTTGGTTCPAVACPAFVCPGGFSPNPDPCGCPICDTRDAGADAPADAECLRVPCPFVKCAAGYELSTPVCGCPTCVPVDGGALDTVTCPPIACTTIACVNGTLPNPDPCGCPICAPVDAAPDTTKPACVGLDECACMAASACSVIAESCYCPFPKCSDEGACICGGGRFIGCAPAGLTACKDAKARVASLCPQLKGSIWDGLCDQSSSMCAAKCLNDVNTCGDISCSMCEACDCASDAFMRCMGSCKTALAQK